MDESFQKPKDILRECACLELLHAARVPRVPAYIGHEVRGSRVIMAQELVQHSEPVGRWVENATGAVFLTQAGVGSL